MRNISLRRVRFLTFPSCTSKSYMIITTETRIGTLVKMDVTSKLANESLESMLILESKLMGCDEFLTCEEVFPVCLLKILFIYVVTLSTANPVKFTMKLDLSKLFIIYNL